MWVLLLLLYSKPSS